MNIHRPLFRSLAGLAASLLMVGSAAAQNAEGRRHAPGPFDTVVMSGSATIKLLQGNEDSVFVEGDDDAQQAVSLDLEGRTLRVSPSGAWKFWRGKPQQIVVTARDLKRIEISGAGDVIAPEAMQMRELQVRISGAGSVRLDKLKVGALDFSVSGSGTGTMAGSADELRVRISGRGTYLGENLAAQTAKVTVSGAGEVKVWATKELTATVSGVATVDFWGSAAVHRTNSGLMTWNQHGPKRQ
ncbi:MAG: head GIN domain-containing protein [Caldimonas sp.]